MATSPTPAQLLTIDNVSQAYGRGGDKSAIVLDKISLELNEGEIVGLLGRSGCGKSTLLRIVSGLNRPSSGEVIYRGEKVAGPVDGVAMVFQSFALFPWLTVLANVELGLRAKGVPEPEARRRALQAIDIIGLDGFENAYPKEISGGMRQRVGFARALVVAPSISADGRALLGARRAHRRDAAHRPARPVGRRTHADQIDFDGDA